MARLKKHTDALPEQRNIRGKIIVQTWRGLTVAKAWPRPRGPSSKPSENWWRATFGTAAQMASQPYHLDQDFAVAWTESTKFRPEDLLISAALGKLYEFVDPTGTIKGSVLTVSANPQQTLDLITNTPGSILLRAPQGWIGIPPGLGGQVLTFSDPGTLIWSSMEKSTGIPTQSQLYLSLANDINDVDVSPHFTVPWQQAQIDTDNRWAISPNPERIQFTPEDVGRTAFATFTVGLQALAENLRCLTRIIHFDQNDQLKREAYQENLHPTGTQLSQVSLQTQLIEEGDYLTATTLATGETSANVMQQWTTFGLHMLS